MEILNIPQEQFYTQALVVHSASVSWQRETRNYSLSTISVKAGNPFRYDFFFSSCFYGGLQPLKTHTATCCTGGCSARHCPQIYYLNVSIYNKEKVKKQNIMNRKDT